jgi:hypothetical protein
MFALLLVANGLGSIALEAGDAEIARKYFQQELQLARELPNPRSEAISLSRLCRRVALLEGDTDDAAACLDGCLRLANALG